MDNGPHMFTRFGGRRFLLTLGCGVVNTWLVYAGVITGEVYQVIILGTVGIFIGGNTVQKTWGPAPVNYNAGENNGRQY